MQSAKIKVIGISGALRKTSTNLTAVKFAGSQLPNEYEFSVLDYADLPVYNGDVED